MHRKTCRKKSSRAIVLARDVAIIFLSITVAVLLEKTETIDYLLSYTKDAIYIDSFIAGMFFTSAFTTAPALVALAEIAQSGSVLQNAFFGALGAVVGDFLIFRFIKDSLTENILQLLGKPNSRRFLYLFKGPFVRFLTPFLGAFIIASPLPDELGLMLMGLSKTNTGLFIPFSFMANFIGILLLGIAVQAF